MNETTIETIIEETESETTVSISDIVPQTESGSFTALQTYEPVNYSGYLETITALEFVEVFLLAIFIGYFIANSFFKRMR